MSQQQKLKQAAEALRRIREEAAKREAKQNKTDGDRNGR